MPEALAWKINSTVAILADDTKLYRRTDLPTESKISRKIWTISSNGRKHGWWNFNRLNANLCHWDTSRASTPQPYTSTHGKKIESVQRRATRQLSGFNLLEYEERLKLLGLPMLTFCCFWGDMIETFKILSGTYDEEIAPNCWRAMTTQENTANIPTKMDSRLNLCKYFFTMTIASIWNELPEWVVNAKDV